MWRDWRRRRTPTGLPRFLNPTNMQQSNCFVGQLLSTTLLLFAVIAQRRVEPSASLTSNGATTFPFGCRGPSVFVIGDLPAVWRSC